MLIKSTRIYAHPLPKYVVKYITQQCIVNRLERHIEKTAIATMEEEKVESNKKLCATTSLPLKPLMTRGTSVDHYISRQTNPRQTSLPVSPSKMRGGRKLPPPLLRLNSDPKILPSNEESRSLELENKSKLRSDLESGNVKCGQFLDPNQRIIVQPPPASAPASKKLLVKQKSLGRTLSTSVLRIKKKRSFWSNEKFKQ